jgi:hypothetical protein
MPHTMRRDISQALRNITTTTAAKSSVTIGFVNRFTALPWWHDVCSFVRTAQRSDNLMMRITENFQKGETIGFRLDGTLTADSCAELEALCIQYQVSEGKLIQLDMAGVVFMNEEVAKRLAELRSDRLSIINCSPFIEMLLRMVAK